MSVPVCPIGGAFHECIKECRFRYGEECLICIYMRSATHSQMQTVKPHSAWIYGNKKHEYVCPVCKKVIAFQGEPTDVCPACKTTLVTYK